MYVGESRTPLARRRSRAVAMTRLTLWGVLLSGDDDVRPVVKLMFPRIVPRRKISYTSSILDHDVRQRREKLRAREWRRDR